MLLKNPKPYKLLKKNVTGLSRWKCFHFYPVHILQIRVPLENHLCPLTCGFFVAFMQMLFWFNSKQFSMRVPGQNIMKRTFFYFLFLDYYLYNHSKILCWISYSVFYIPLSSPAKNIHFLANPFLCFAISIKIPQTVLVHIDWLKFFKKL